MSVDLERADATLAYIEKHPQGWRQDVWFCGTGGCFAGITLLADGWHPVTDDVVEKEGEREEVAAAAANLLGLSSRQARRMFYVSNTLEDLRQAVAELHGAPTKPLSWEPPNVGEIL